MDVESHKLKRKLLSYIVTIRTTDFLVRRGGRPVLQIDAKGVIRMPLRSEEGMANDGLEVLRTSGNVQLHNFIYFLVNAS